MSAKHRSPINGNGDVMVVKGFFLDVLSKKKGTVKAAGGALEGWPQLCERN